MIGVVAAATFGRVGGLVLGAVEGGGRGYKQAEELLWRAGVSQCQ